ncbi:MAG: SAM-dependent chlorinase/fluorinase [Rhodothermales bacterium]|nr:SAM-dependent chlorinase/fluorinase [Rhodothermales bacterium]
MERPSGIITFLTDFGTRDAYVSAMKGVALSVLPEANLVDISHDIPPQDVMQAAFVLRESAAWFPTGTVHVCVVDPGVGTERAAIAIRSQDQYFVGPDNGIFSLVLGRADHEAVVLDNPDFWRSADLSTTFHGRDVFAPAAAHLAAGRSLDQLGSPLDKLRPLHWALPIHDDQGIRGWVVHVDRFGNCITNITRDVFEAGRLDRRFKCYAGTVIVDQLRATYGSVEAGDPVLLFNSSGLLEIAVSRGNGAELYGLRTGSPINVVFLDGQAG